MEQKRAGLVHELLSAKEKLCTEYILNDLHNTKQFVHNYGNKIKLPTWAVVIWNRTFEPFLL